MSQTISDSIASSVTLTAPTTVTSTGTINASPAGVVDGDGAGILLNEGSINGQPFAVSLSNGGSVTNEAGAELSGVAAVDIADYGAVTNAGLISGIGAGIIMSTGSINNETSGTITGGVQLSSGQVTNSGTIQIAHGNIVALSHGGAVYNLGAQAELTGGAVLGVFITGADGYVLNQGSISGVALDAGGSINNQGYIATGSASDAITIDGASGSITNAGSIVGISLQDGGSINNELAGVISGNIDGIDLTAGGTILNNGTILGTGGLAGQLRPGSFGDTGISAAGDSTITNEKTGQITGTKYGIQTSGSGGDATITNYGTIRGAEGIQTSGSVNTTIVDYGTIIGGNGTAIDFEGSNNILILEAGAVLNGDVFGGGGNNTIEFAAGFAIGDTTDFATEFAGINNFVNLEPEFSFDGVISASQTFENTGMVLVSGVMQVLGDLGNNGTIIGAVTLGGSYANMSAPSTVSTTLVNEAGGLIRSNTSIALDAVTGSNPVTIENTGTITDTAAGGYAVSLAGGQGDLLIIDPGSVLIGKVDGGKAVAGQDGSVLQLGSGSIAGSISGIGTAFTDFSSIAVAAGATWSIADSTIVALTNDGMIILDPTTVTVTGAMTGTGVTEIDTDSALILGGSVSSGQTIAFGGTDGQLIIDNVNEFSGTVLNFTASETIDLAGFSFSSSAQVLSLSGNMLGIYENAFLTEIKLDPTQAGETEYFHLSSDGLNGTDITESATPCFLAGTMIRTPAGETAVQDLKIGDLITTEAGLAKPIKWIGRRSYTSPFPPNPDIIPVLIKANALADGAPDRDLYISPLHAVALEGFLVPAGALVNGVSVLNDNALTKIDYYHIETEDHDIIVANNAPAETFIDENSRKMFENAGEYFRLYPQASRASYVLCAPRLEFGAELERLRRKIALRAGVLLDHPGASRIIGYLEIADRQTITGWAYAPAMPNVPVSLEILNHGALLARTIANIPRADVKVAGFGHGRCGFSITLPAPLPALMRHEISVRPAGATTCLTGSPIIIDPAIAHDLTQTGGLQLLLEAAVKGMSSAKDITFFGNSLEAFGKRIKSTAEVPRQAERAAGKRISADERPSVLILDEAWPTAMLDAGSNAILSHAKAFQSLGYRTHFCATSGLPKTDAAYKGMQALEAMDVQCHGQDGIAAEETIRALAEAGLAAVYLHRLATASAYGGLVRQYARDAKVIFAVADLHHLRLARQAEATDRPDLVLKSRSVKAAEFWAMRLADGVLTHSSFEAAYLRRETPNINVHVVPWAVAATPPLSLGRKRQHIAFLGGSGHAPNLDAVTHLARDIMPLIWDSEPEVKCLIAGDGWSENFFQTLDPRIVRMGHQPDLGAFLRSVKLTVAPLRFGAGLKGKVLDSFAAGTACAMSEIAAEGLPLDPALRMLVGDGMALAKNVLAVLHDKRLNRMAVQSGLDMIQTSFSQEAVNDALAMALDRPRNETVDAGLEFPRSLQKLRRV